MKLSSSPERGSFQRNKYIERQTEKDKMYDPENDKMIELFKSFDQLKFEQEQDPEWQKNNLEWDLRTTDWILKKVREDDIYAQNLYAALCNNDFIKNEVWPILQDQDWGCSWRHAGGIIADMREEGDYIDWYCSGIKFHPSKDIHLTDEEIEQNKLYEKYVGESVVTDEIRKDLLKLGWIVVDDDNVE